MSDCDAELCPYWTGQGCICAVIDMDHGNQWPATFPTDDDDEPPAPVLRDMQGDSR